ncbi:MAG: hypothetical protein ACI9C1_002273 [Candidatus Aldehydirespiratoraceae bacterium]|jgi:hypothetical protein
MTKSTMRPISIALVTIIMAASCGGGSESETTNPPFVEQGASTLADDADVPTDSAAPGDAAGGASESDEPAGDAGDPDSVETEDTIPQNEDDTPAVANLFSSMGVFQSCLEDEGHAFIGQPDAELEASDPVNDSAYIEALTHCAAVSDIQASFTAMQSESDSLDAEGIEERNRQLIHWMDCMEGRGWTFSGVSADARGLNQPSGMEGPDGASFLDSDDMGECATVAGESYEAELEAEGAGE